MSRNIALSPVWDPSIFAPVWSHVGAHQVANAEALDALGSLENGSLDAVVADPPYCSGGSSEADRVAAQSQGVRTGQWFVGDAMTSSVYGLFLERLAQLCVAKINPETGSVLIFTDHKMVEVVIKAFSLAGLRLRSVLTWDKMAQGRLLSLTQDTAHG